MLLVDITYVLQYNHHIIRVFPVSEHRRSLYVGLMFDHRPLRWHNSKPTKGQRLVSMPSPPIYSSSIQDRDYFGID